MVRASCFAAAVLIALGIAVEMIHTAPVAPAELRVGDFPNARRRIGGTVSVTGRVNFCDGDYVTLSDPEIGVIPVIDVWFVPGGAAGVQAGQTITVSGTICPGGPHVRQQCDLKNAALVR